MQNGDWMTKSRDQKEPLGRKKTGIYRLVAIISSGTLPKSFIEEKEKAMGQKKNIRNTAY